MAELEEDYCERCGDYQAGVRKWMFHSTYARFPGPPIAREFYCFACLRVMRIYAIIGLTLLAILVGSLIGVTIWLTAS